MASIFKNARSKKWQMGFYNAQGKQVQKSSGTTDAKIARKMADALEEANRKARQGQLTSARLKTLLNETLAGTGVELVETTLADYIDSWIEGKKGTITASSMAKYKPTLERFCTFLGGKANRPISSISTQDILRYRSQMQSDGIKIQSIKNMLIIIKAPFTDAIREGILQLNPFSTVRPLKEAHDTDSQGRESFSMEEITKLLQTTSGEWYGLILLALTAGLRLGDASRLQWKSIDLDNATIKVTTQKTGTRLMIPIHGTLLKWIQTQPVGIAQAPLFPTLARTPTPTLANEFQAILSTAGIDAKPTAGSGTKGRVTRAKSFHSLRHTFVTMMANNDVSSETRQTLAGHSSADVHAGYTHLDTSVLKKAIDSIKIA